jgi:hypothetical protein
LIDVLSKVANLRSSGAVPATSQEKTRENLQSAKEELGPPGLDRYFLITSLHIGGPVKADAVKDQRSQFKRLWILKSVQQKQYYLQKAEG